MGEVCTARGEIPYEGSLGHVGHGGGSSRSGMNCSRAVDKRDGPLGL